MWASAAGDPIATQGLGAWSSSVAMDATDDGVARGQMLRVATAGGTDAARLAGQYTAICPSTHSTTAPIGR
ncbi:hypothetical protein LUTEI9C_130075 [Luteimonas sp. 9C]|nr:hypothetical protein LUTEI9C_130075 [Luteimonas sp. 9C]